MEVELRRKSAEVIRAWLATFLREQFGKDKRGRARLPIILAGDFNSPAGEEESSIYPVFVPGEAPVAFQDAWVLAHAPEALKRLTDAEQIEAAAQRRTPGTYHGFKGDKLKTTSRIDWLLVRGNLAVERATKLEGRVEGRYPSDHYPVVMRAFLR
ncbi:hypothetical protein ACFL59_11030 [Planctomycetota bacterium]